ncbi:endothelin-converting enzyme 1 [Stomoxys calcitrans]|uniref:endothelin-converting enzyme 1 n=1 Tax=Stomoxys calcitrans TaxID=35570 RepID=UPI0027E2F693|nr:endothelin-converting enzyme 1 [Stomoxys calcitrans]
MEKLTKRIFAAYALLAVLAMCFQHGSTLSIAELKPETPVEAVRQAISQQIAKYMNLSVDPCENFYEYSCGNFAQYNPVTAENPAVGIGELLAKTMEARITQELESDDESDSDAIKNVRKFYQSCLGVQTAKQFYIDSMLEQIEELGDMPLLEGEFWNSENFDWRETVYEMIRESGLPNIFEVRVMANFHNNSENRIFVGQPVLVDRDEILARDRDNYVEAISSWFQAYLQVEDEELALETAKEVFDFDIALAQGMLDERGGAQRFDAYFPADSYLTEGDEIHELVKDVMGEPISLDMIMVQRDYVDHTRDLLRKTPNETIANYVYYTYLYEYFFQTQGEEDHQVQEYCVAQTRKYFYKLLDNLIYRKYFTHDAENMLYDMWRQFKLAFRNILISPRLDWIQGETKRNAIEKLKYMKLKILSYEDQPEIATEIGQLELSDSHYTANIHKILLAYGEKARDLWHKPPRGVEIGVEASNTATYDPFMNVVQVPIGFMQPFYTWSSSYPAAYNFGFLGYFIAHEIVHGFDDTGRHYDAHGNARPWWDDETDRQFRQRTPCFVNQFQNLMYEGQHLAKMESQAENIADASGIRLAFEAYMNWYHKGTLKGHSMAKESLPNFSQFTHKQLFFISYGQVWCSNYDPSVVAMQLADTHTPNKLRDIGPLADYDEFAIAFNCPVGTFMNPQEKCIIY